jgi:hypothetical protein
LLFLLTMSKRFSVENEGTDGSQTAFSIRTPRLLSANSYMSNAKIRDLESKADYLVPKETFYRLVASICPLVREYNVKLKHKSMFKERANTEEFLKYFAEEDLTSYFIEEPCQIYDKQHLWFVHVAEEHCDIVEGILIKAIENFVE